MLFGSNEFENESKEKVYNKKWQPEISVNSNAVIHIYKFKYKFKISLLLIDSLGSLSQW